MMHVASLNRITRTSYAIGWFIIAILLIGEAGLLAMRWRGYELLSVQSNSMQPVLTKGDAVIVNRSARQPQAGSIISFISPEAPGVTISHRVISVNTANGTMLTKGDSAEAIDPPVSTAALRGTVVGALPVIGGIVDLFRRPVGIAIAVYVPVLAIVIFEIRKYARSLSSAKPSYVRHPAIRRQRSSHKSHLSFSARRV